MKYKKEKTKKRKGVCVFWGDAHSIDAWHDEKDAIEFAEKRSKNLCRTYGVIIKMTQKYLLIGSSLTEDEDAFGDLMMIPRKMVSKIIKLKI